MHQNILRFYSWRICKINLRRNYIKFLNVRYAVSCNSVLLSFSLEVSGVKPKDEVVVPTMSFIATANAVRYLDANPVFIDYDKFLIYDYDKTKSFLLKKLFQRMAKPLTKKQIEKLRTLIVTCLVMLRTLKKF